MAHPGSPVIESTLHPATSGLQGLPGLQRPPGLLLLDLPTVGECFLWRTRGEVQDQELGGEPEDEWRSQEEGAGAGSA